MSRKTIKLDSTGNQRSEHKEVDMTSPIFK